MVTGWEERGKGEGAHMVLVVQAGFGGKEGSTSLN